MHNTYNSTKDNKEKLYHREVYWKDNFDKNSYKLIDKNDIRYSLHMEENFALPINDKHRIDKYILNNIISNISFDDIKPFEVLVYNGEVIKTVIRIPYDDKYDISIVFRKGLVITAWLNEKSDIHITINKTKYVKENDMVQKFRASEYDVEQITKYIYKLNINPTTSKDNIILNAIMFWELDHNDCINEQIPRHDINWYLDNILNVEDLDYVR